jgi:hypothetical protein
MARKGRGDADLPDSVFDVYGEGHYPVTCNMLETIGFKAVRGQDDYNLRQFDFSPITGIDGMSNQQQAASVNASIQGWVPGRTPTPFWEYAFLGMGQSRSAYIDPETVGVNAQWRQTFRPQNDDSALQWWPPTYTQEVYAPYTGPIDEVWGDSF